MFHPLMWPCSGRYKQEYSLQSVRTVPPLKINYIISVYIQYLKGDFKTMFNI